MRETGAHRKAWNTSCALLSMIVALLPTPAAAGEADFRELLDEANRKAAELESLQVQRPTGSVAPGEITRAVIKLPKEQGKLDARVLFGGGELGSLDWDAEQPCAAAGPFTSELKNIEAKAGSALFCLQAGADPAGGEIVLLLESGEASALHTVTVTPPRGQIEQSPSSEHSFEFRRSAPWKSAGGRVRLPLIETGKGDIRELSLRVPLPRGDRTTGRAVHARHPGMHFDCPRQGAAARMRCPEVLVFPPERSSGDAAENGKCTPAGPFLGKGDDSDLEFELAGFDHAGEFEVDLLLSSDDLASPLILPIKVIVTDDPIFPFAVILLGVLLAFLITRAMNSIEATRELVRTASSFDAEGRGGNSWLSAARLSNRVSLVPKSLAHGLMQKAVDKGEEAGGRMADARKHLHEAGVLVRKSRMEAGQLGLFVVALVLGAAAGFHELYYETYFGTPKQYLGAFLWGVSSRFALGALTALVKKVAP